MNFKIVKSGYENRSSSIQSLSGWISEGCEIYSTHLIDGVWQERYLGIISYRTLVFLSIEFVTRAVKNHPGPPVEGLDEIIGTLRDWLRTPQNAERGLADPSKTWRAGQPVKDTLTNMLFLTNMLLRIYYNPSDATWAYREIIAAISDLAYSRGYWLDSPVDLTRTMGAYYREDPTSVQGARGIEWRERELAWQGGFIIHHLKSDDYLFNLT